MTASTSPWPSPKWLDGITDDSEREAARHRYLLNLACVFHSKDARTSDLADALGVTANNLSIIKARGRVSPEMAIDIERILGRDHFPRELFNPALYAE